MSGLGSMLRRHREVARLTQEELADRATVSARTISDIERGLRSRIYRDTARRLSDALGLTGEASETFLDVARGSPGSSYQAAPHRVPRPLTPLLGRDRELADLVDALGTSSGVRLVTATGLGGVGKSSLALAVAGELEAAYRGRVHIHTIAADQDPANLTGAMARAMGLSDQTSSDALGAHLTGRPTLLVLDEFEHVLEAAGVVEAALQSAPELRILATSRRRLGIAGERELALTPLTLPEPSDPGWADTPAAALFLERVEAHSPDLTMGAELVIDMCRRVSGIPLALELAAARVRHLPLAVLRDRLEGGFGDLTESPGLTDRPRSMEQVLAWSVEGLSSDESLVLRIASAFTGGWRLDAAQQLCGGGVDVVRATSGLVDHGLVTLDRASGHAVAVPRWRMLDVVREFVRGQAGAVPAGLRARFTAFYVDLVTGVQQHLGREHDWFELLATEESNIRTALTWAADSHDAETLLRLAGGMWQYWQARGALVEGREWLSTGLDLSPPAGDQVRMTALWGLGWLAYHQGDDAVAEAAAGRLEELARLHADEGARRHALTLHGMGAISRESTEEAARLLGDALDIARGLGSGWILATSLMNMGLAHLAGEEITRARDVLAEALAAYDELGDERFRARCLAYLGLASLLEDDPTRARALFGQSLTVFGDLAEPEGTAEGLAGLAAVDSATGHETRAARLAGASERLHESYAGRALPLEGRATARYLASAERALGSETWSEEWQLGRELSPAEAIDLALATEPSDGSGVSGRS